MSTVPILIAEDDRRNIVIDRPAIVVGRSRRRSDVRIDDPSISAVHCEIEVGENCLRVRNRGRNGIRINGRKSDQGVLYDGDVFEIARLKYRVLIKGDPRQPNASQLSSSNDWFVRLAGMELGPMPWAELSLMAQRGELTGADEVRWSKQRHWRSAATTDGLFDKESTADSESESPTALRAASHRPVEKPGDKKLTEQSDDDDQSWTGNFKALDDSEESSIIDRESIMDTVTDFLDETASSVHTSWLAGPPSNDSGEIGFEAEFVGQEVIDERRSNDDQRRSADPPVKIAARIEPPEALNPNPSENGLPPLPVPPPFNVAPQPAPYKPPPMPKIARSDTILDVIYNSVLEPVFNRVPLLRTWPGVATVAAALVIAFWMMSPTYEGAEVSGRVTLNGQPLTDATISFTDLKNGFGASAVVGSDGTFEVITLKGGMKPGTYSVAVMPLKPESPEVVSELQRQFSESQNGGMHDEEMMGEGEPGYRPGRSVEESEEQTFQLPATTIPFTYRSIQTSGLSKEITEDGPNELLIELVGS